MIAPPRRLRVIGAAMVAWIAAVPAWATTVTDTAAADISAGTVGTCYVAETTDGELLLLPTVGAEISGSTLPSDWASFDWSGGSGTVSVGGGLLTLYQSRA